MSDRLNILWASMWGNAEMVAKKLNHIAKEKGIEADLKEMDDISSVSYTHLTLPTILLV